MSSAEAVINKCIVPVSRHEGICVLHACYRCERDALPTELRPRANRYEAPQALANLQAAFSADFPDFPSVRLNLLLLMAKKFRLVRQGLDQEIITASRPGKSVALSSQPPDQ